MRRVTLAAGFAAAALTGCGGTTATVTPLTTPTPPPAVVPSSVIAGVERSLVPVYCESSSAGLVFSGTGFKVATGVVSASHVVAACPPGSTVDFGEPSGTVVAQDTTHDLARLTYQSSGATLSPLQLEPAAAYLGEPVALIGVPGSRGAPRVSLGLVVATRWPKTLTPRQEGLRKTLPDAIIVIASPRVLPAESGGPAIDASGKVVGVVEGGGQRLAVLTPVSDLAPLH